MKPGAKKGLVYAGGLLVGLFVLLAIIGAMLPAEDEANEPKQEQAKDKPPKQVELEVDAPASTSKPTAVTTGTVTPATAEVRVARPIETGDTRVEVNAEGEFRVRVKLARGSNTAVAYGEAEGYKDALEQSVVITRTETKAERDARLAREAQKRQEAKERREAREQRRQERAAHANAIQSARDYLAYGGFSQQGLAEQLVFEGYEQADAEYAAANAGADFNAEAAESAQEYLDYSSFSRSGLIEQLTFEGYTYEQAEYGVNKVYAG